MQSEEERAEILWSMGAAESSTFKVGILSCCFPRISELQGEG
ncbi:hypothetical protein NBRC3278_2844 [Acetobacter pasteurianus NBRC 3278]|uniref:Uncharacterized protein n=1 Tax=Acetobacter pasteurianus NBRC 3278 TaxID=1226660 RepID=A0A401X779_ACEPA|nr:hypothetical protein NBRC3278_2844 [Acetobacter pasteurianus NBRC 3278]